MAWIHNYLEGCRSMTYSEALFERYCQRVEIMYRQGYLVEEIARVMESDVDLVRKVVEQRVPVTNSEKSIVTL